MFSRRDYCLPASIFAILGMPKELDERFGPSEQSLREASRAGQSRHRIFRVRIVPAILLGLIGVGITLFGRSAVVSVLAYLITDSAYLIANDLAEGMMTALLGVTATVCGVAAVGAAIHCWRGKWKSMTTAMVMFVAAGCATMILLSFMK
jgi:hypothetical protein